MCSPEIKAIKQRHTSVHNSLIESLLVLSFTAQNAGEVLCTSARVNECLEGEWGFLKGRKTEYLLVQKEAH